MKPMKLSKLPLFFLLTSALIACGQPGKLYLPDKPAPVHVEPEAKPEPIKNQ
jgi:predicted small lipoprotein YifL